MKVFRKLTIAAALTASVAGTAFAQDLSSSERVELEALKQQVRQIAETRQVNKTT